MPSKQSNSKTLRLKGLGIRRFDVLIHEQSKEWLIEHLSSGKREYPINVSLLMRNTIWQLRDRILQNKREPLRELVRTFWYMYIKPTLARAGALTHETDQYNQLVDTLTKMVKDWNLMEYKDIGFRDNNRANRVVGFNSNIIVFSEKLGHQDFLSEIRNAYQVSILALGGQPSVMNVEYFVDDLKKQKVDLRMSFFLFSVVDFDPSGWIIRDAFIDDLRHYGIKHIKCVDLIHPDMLTPEEVMASRYPVPDSEGMRKKNTAWVREVKRKKYKNQKLIGPFRASKDKRVIFGLEAEAVSSKRIEAALSSLLPPLLGASDDLITIRNLSVINASIKELILLQLT